MVLFSDATPSDSNLTSGYSGLLSEPTASSTGGFYLSPISITLTPGSVNDTIRYTLDGSDPDYTSTIYSLPILINSTKVLRARSFNSGLMPSRTMTNSYFINFSTALTVVSLSTNPGNFLMKNMEFIRLVIVLRQNFHTSVQTFGRIGNDQYT